MFKELIEKFKKKKLEEKIINKFGCILYCFKCKNILDGFAEKSKTPCCYNYKCKHCGAESTFDYSYPAPVKVDYAR